MLGKKIDIKQSAILAAVLAASVWVVSYLAGLFGQTVGELFVSVPVTSVLTGSIGTKVLGFIGGVVPIGDLGSMGFLTLFISALVAVVLGEQLIDRLKLPVFKNFLGFNGRVARLASVILWGAVPVYALLIGFSAPSITNIIGALVHTIAVSFVAVFGANMLKLNI